MKKRIFAAGLAMLLTALAAGAVLTLAACAAAPTPTPTPTPPTPTPTPLPTPTPEWGIAYAALDPQMVGEPMGGNLRLSLRLIRCDGSQTIDLTGKMEGITNLTASADGRYLLFSTRREDTSGESSLSYFDLPHLYVLDVQTAEVFTMTSGSDTMEEIGGAWSPDGNFIAFASAQVNASNYARVNEIHTHLYVMKRDGTDRTRISTQEGTVYSVAWSPTGERILFEQNGAVWVVNPDGTGLFKVADASIRAQPAWSPDGGRVAFAAPGVGEDRNADIFVVNADGSGLVNLTQDSSADFQPAWSPDGQRIAFLTTRHGQREWAIYIMNIDGSNCKQVFYNTVWVARDPIWSPDSSRVILVGMRGPWEEQLFITDLAGNSRLLSEEYIEDRPAWVLMSRR